MNTPLTPIQPYSVNAGITHLRSVDADIARALEQVGPPAPRIRPAGFETFVSTIVSQQISTAAATAIMARVKQCLPDMQAQTVQAIPIETLRSAGLSQRKVEYIKGLAAAVLDGQLDLDALQHMDTEEAITQITALRGFGRWSAEIYLMFSLQQADIFPADDLAIRAALGHLKGLQERPTPKQCRSIVEHWAPYRSVGSLFLWHYYHNIS